MPPSAIKSDHELEVRDLAFGADVLKIVLVLNVAMMGLLLVSLAAPLGFLQEVPLWIFGLEILFFVLFFLPAFVYRLASKKERPALAASRAAHWFIDALSLAA